MVLEAATAPPDDASTFQDAPASDNDPYASSFDTFSGGNGDLKNGKLTYPVDLDRLPKPFGLLFVTRPISPAIIDALNAQSHAASVVLGRRLKQDEADALAFHTAKAFRLGSMGTPFGVATGIAIAFQGRSKFSFPFWRRKENSTFNPNKFGPLTGPSARALWHGLRGSAYGIIGAFFGSIFFASYAMTVSSVGKAQDPRLAEWLQALIKARERSQGVPEQQRGRTSPVTTPEGAMDAQVDRAQRTLQRSRERPAQRQQVEQDDMSPTSGTWAQDDAQLADDFGMMSDAQMERQQGKTEPSEQESPSNSRRTGTTTADRGVRAGSDARNDDAFGDSFSSSRPLPTGSSWERIRAEAAAGQGTSAKPGQRRDTQMSQAQDSAAGADSFSFSQRDEDRQLARTEAQKDFDARVERERRGEDFESSRGRR